MLLVGFRRKQRLEQPAPIRDLSDVANFGKCRDTFLHDLGFAFAVEYLLDGNGPCRFSVYHAFIIFLNGTKTPFSSNTDQYSRMIL
jgi:hypothetical protein